MKSAEVAPCFGDHLVASNVYTLMSVRRGRGKSDHWPVGKGVGARDSDTLPFHVGGSR